jgi:hypothetical protein
MDVNAMIGGRWMTYAELGELIGASPEAGRQLALRLKLRKQIGNEDKRIRVWVDEDAVARRAVRPTPVQMPVKAPVGHRIQTPIQQDAQTGELNALREHLTTLERLMGQQQADHAAELDRARLNADRWREIADRERETVHALFDQLKELIDCHAKLHADCARLEAQIAAPAEHRARLEMDVAGLKSELDQECVRSADLKAEAEHQAREIDRLSAELEQARRPWWRQVIGK